MAESGSSGADLLAQAACQNESSGSVNITLPDAKRARESDPSGDASITGAVCQEKGNPSRSSSSGSSGRGIVRERVDHYEALACAAIPTRLLERPGGESSATVKAESDTFSCDSKSSEFDRIRAALERHEAACRLREEELEVAKLKEQLANMTSSRGSRSGRASRRSAGPSGMGSPGAPEALRAKLDEHRATLEAPGAGS